jgi:hypothetical protein
VKGLRDWWYRMRRTGAAIPSVVSDVVFRQSPFFGQTVVPGGRVVALTRVLAASSLTSLAESDQQWVFVARTTRVPITSGARVWWRLRTSEGTRYLSYNPGEYRHEPPTGEGHVVRDPPEDVSVPLLSTLLREAIDASPVPGFDDAEDLARLNNSANEWLSTETAGYGAASARFGEISRQMARGELEPRSGLETLVNEFLFGCKFSVTQFSPALLLVQLQLQLGMWIAQHIDYTDPRDALHSFAAAMVEERRDKVREALVRIGDAEFFAAKPMLRAALEASSCLQSTRILRLAAHRFLVARAALSLDAALELEGRFEYTPVLAEEGCACAGGGIVSGLELFLSKPIEFLAELHSRLPTQVSVRERVEAITALLCPTYPRAFARTLVHGAVASGPDGARHIAAFEASANELAGDFEESWAQTALLAVAKRHGDEQRTTRYATRLAARMIVARAMGHQDDHPRR